jgi:hypothetical protein
VITSLLNCLYPNVKGVKAMGRRTSEGFVLLKGSQLSHSISEVGGDSLYPNHQHIFFVVT